MLGWKAKEIENKKKRHGNSNKSTTTLSSTNSFISRSSTMKSQFWGNVCKLLSAAQAEVDINTSTSSFQSYKNECLLKEGCNCSCLTKKFHCCERSWCQMVVHLKICALAFVPRNVYKYKNLLTFDFISAADKILSCLNQEHTNHADPSWITFKKWI